ncbi:MAG: Asp23/Gls24 family envelope stress response protein [Tissierellia bacterium]|nr:Asp23/Gls24 family envelope stress response protein [Tissierellia bacterium]
MPKTINKQNGSIIIEDQILATIAGISAMESYGIVGMASKSTTEDIIQLLKMDNFTKGIEVSTQDEDLLIRLHVIIEYGVRISTVGQNVIDQVKFNIKSLTGLDVDKIEVLVEDIRMD